VTSDSMNLAQTQRNVVVLGASGIFSSQTYGKKCSTLCHCPLQCNFQEHKPHKMWVLTILDAVLSINIQVQWTWQRNQNPMSF